jgi:peptide/nickel transport system permease protein
MMLLRLIVRRLAFLVIVLLGLSLITFTLSHVIPADPARLYAGPRASAATVQQIRHQFGFDRPIWTQYGAYLGGITHGDFGYSLTSHRPVGADIHDYLPATIELTLAAIVIILLVGIPLGVVAAVWHGSIVDHLSRVIAITGVSIPAFWLGLMAQLLLFDKLNLFPADGRLSAATAAPPTITGLYTLDSLLTGQGGLFLQSLWYLALPAAVLAYGSLSVLTRMVRASMLEALGQDFVRTARSKGLRQRAVVMRHALRNALLPATTVMGLQIGFLLGGALLVEDVFAWPGIGRYATLATLNLDYNAIMAVTLIAALIYVLANLLVDILYLVLDPRVTY